MAIQSIVQWKIADPIEGINYEYTFSPAPRSKSIEFVPPLCENKIGMDGKYAFLKGDANGD